MTYRDVVHLPIGLFSSVMGLTGLSVAWMQAHLQLGAPPIVAETVGAIALLTFVFLTVGYGAKIICFPAEALAEFRHPIAGNLFGTFLISLLLLPILLAPRALILARAMWILGALGISLFSWLIVSRWLSQRQLLAHATPAWIVPVVGVLDVPLALPALQWPPLPGLILVCIAIGFFFAVPLFTMIFSRLLFEEPMPAVLQPSLLILVAPFSVGFSTYVLAAAQIDRFAQALFTLMLFVLTVLLGRLKMLGSNNPFHVLWWVVSFPLATAAVAALRFAADAGNPLATGLAWLLLGIATLVIGSLLVRSVIGMIRGEVGILSV
jgi:tellurite resistance protein